MAVTSEDFGKVEGKEFYLRLLLKVLRETNIMLQFTEKVVIPKHHGETITWRKRLPITPPSAPLTEGVTPNKNKIGYVEYAAKIQEFGDWVELSKKFVDLAIDPIITDAVEEMGESAAEMFDKLVRDEFYRSPNVFYANKKAKGTITDGDVFSISDLNTIKALFKRRNVKPYMDNNYIMIITPEVEFDIKNDTKGLNNNGLNWTDVGKYVDGEKIMRGEIGKMLGFKFISYNDLKVVNEGSGSDVPVHKCIAFGKKAVGAVDLEGNNAENIKVWFNKPGEVGEDPLKQRCSVAWKCEGFATRMLYAEAIVIYNCASTLEVPADLAEDTHPNYVQDVMGGANALQKFGTQE